ncbi:WD40-repeat-containing domain protein [Pelagophyceae sp. CCMP2097]|nr:WD40-repeat-containing domain protein [Pelagophyceae sp. CCMP2097]
MRGEYGARADEAAKAQLRAKLAMAEADVQALREYIGGVLNKMAAALPESNGDGSKPAHRVKMRRVLKGHTNKCVSCSWYDDSRKLLTASQDGHAITWDAKQGTKKQMCQLRSQWAMFAEVSKLEATKFASGGLDNTVTLYAGTKLKCDFAGHAGYVSAARFLDEQTIVSASGDATLGLFKVTERATEEDKRVAVFRGHEQDVTSVDLHPSSAQQFISSSSDGTVMVWSTSAAKPALVLRQPGAAPDGAEVNGCKYQSNGFGVGLATERGGCFLYDVRARGPVAAFSCETGDVRKNAVAFSASGRLMFVASSDCGVDVWDTADSCGKPGRVVSHFTKAVVDVATAPDGNGVACCSYDTECGILSA